MLLLWCVLWLIFRRQQHRGWEIAVWRVSLENNCRCRAAVTPYEICGRYPSGFA